MKRFALIITLTMLLPACDNGADTVMQSASGIETVSGAKSTDTHEPERRDPLLWLEEVEAERALQTVRAWNAQSLERLTGDERFESFQTDTLAIVNANDKIPFGAYRGGYIYNFWQDADSVRGVLRRTSLEDYRSAAPNWEVLLDVDALSATEQANWVYKGSTCLAPAYTRCLLRLSDGGKDASEQREWDHTEKAFVEHGFYVPEAKARVAWEDVDTLLIATDWGEGTLTQSGYPFILKRWLRGSDMSDATE